MRMRYERRDPRAEDVREIQELRNRVEAQDQDLRKLAESLREMQMVQEQQNVGGNLAMKQQPKNRKKLNCEIIYEENEERDSTPPPPPPSSSSSSSSGITNGNGTCVNGGNTTTNTTDNADEDEADDDDADDDDEDENNDCSVKNE